MNVAEVPIMAQRESSATASDTPRSVLVGLIGTGIQASRAPALHEHEGATQNLAYVYRLIDLDALGLSADALPELMAAARRFGFNGLNVTHPCKQTIIPLLDELSADAPRRRVVQVGAGGAGVAVAHALLTLGAGEVTIVDMNAARAARLAQDLRARFGAGRAGAARDPARALAAADGLVNATPVGMAKH